MRAQAGVISPKGGYKANSIAYVIYKPKGRIPVNRLAFRAARAGRGACDYVSPRGAALAPSFSSTVFMAPRPAKAPSTRRRRGISKRFATLHAHSYGVPAPQRIGGSHDVCNLLPSARQLRSIAFRLSTNLYAYVGNTPRLRRCAFSAKWRTPFHWRRTQKCLHDRVESDVSDLAKSLFRCACREIE